MTLNVAIPKERRGHVVLVAYYFPPLGGSGVQRVAKWAKYLPQFGWDVTVLTVEPGAYLAFDESLFKEVTNAGVNIVRTSTLDPTRTRKGNRAVRRLSERKRKLLTWLTGLFFLPDNKRGWRGKARSAFNMVTERGPVDVVLSSAPPYTALMVGDELAGHLGVPHIVDYRDDWIDNPRHRYPTAFHKRWHIRKEGDILACSALVLAINESIASLIRTRNPRVKVEVLPQGYDPDDFPSDTIDGRSDGRVRIVYAGMFYDAQQPDSMLEAVSRLLMDQPSLRSKIELRFIGLFPDEKTGLISKYDLGDVVTRTGYKNHEETVAELKKADLLWMIVGHQPGGYMISTGKLFEYMGSGRPILALAPEGEVRVALQGYGAAWTVDPADVYDISRKLGELVQMALDDDLPQGLPEWIARYDRRASTRKLADLLASVCS
jgi:glycosyltransferase involved in cell wall biosynthesis